MLLSSQWRWCREASAAPGISLGAGGWDDHIHCRALGPEAALGLRIDAFGKGL